jgi:hypothetical protein
VRPRTSKAIDLTGGAAREEQGAFKTGTGGSSSSPPRASLLAPRRLTGDRGRRSCDGCVRVGLARAVAPMPKIDPLKRFGGARRVSDLSQVNAVSLASWFKLRGQP